MGKDPEEVYRNKEMDRMHDLGTALDTKIEETSIRSERLDQLVGICSTCTKFHYECTRLNTERFTCSRLINDGASNPIRLNTSDPIVECSTYSKKVQLSLWEMKDLAILIEGRGAKKAPGFKRDEWSSEYDK